MHANLYLLLTWLILQPALSPCVTPAAAASSSKSALPLGGTWNFALDPEDKGTSLGWFRDSLPDSVKLPGSTDENKKGNAAEEQRSDRLSRVHPYVGPAWYTREVTIPESWTGKRVVVFLERCHWETRLWVDGKSIGMRNSLCMPHVYDLGTTLSAGKHRLSLRVDNQMKVDIGRWAHSVTDETQTNWNGVIGRMELQATDPVWIERVAFYPDLAASSVKAVVNLDNATAAPCQTQLSFSASPDLFASAPAPLQMTIPAGERQVEIALPVRKDARLWDEFSPALYELDTVLTATSGEKQYHDSLREKLGLRQLRASGKRFLMNGRTLSLRGTLECCIFPLTGYPPTDLTSWRKVLQTARSYGLNHMRFHSWCPPEAAFEAADELGMMLQIENPIWVTDGQTADKPERAAFFYAEAKRICDTYGNHPSFCFMSMGNELLFSRRGDEPFLNRLVSTMQVHDPRHLYTASTAPYGAERVDDYYIAQSISKSMIRGQHRIGIIDTSTDFDWDEALEETTRPVIAHEIGQYAMYPDFREITSYTGVLRAHNFEIFRDALTSAGMADQGEEFFRASGELIARLYKDEIEAALRSRNLSGFALLDLHDFPGQGTALVGLLNAFWESKGFVSPEEFHRFCAPTVPLLRTATREWSTTQTFVASAELAHFGPKDLADCQATWKVLNTSGQTVASGSFPSLSVPTGGVTRLGKIAFALGQVRSAQKLTVWLEVEKEKAKNSWDIWVYPPSQDPPASDLVISHAWDEATTRALADGKPVLLFVSWENLARCVPGKLCTVFWNAHMFSQPGTMGILCNPKHPAFADFPTAGFGDWQWLDILKHSAALNLGATPASYRPLLQAVSDFNKTTKLGYMFEARVGKGRLFVCAMDLEKDLGKRPAARQLRTSLLRYVASQRFQPQGELSLECLDQMLAPTAIRQLAGAPKSPERAVLSVRAGVHGDMNHSCPWDYPNDELRKRDEGLTYSLSAHTWREKKNSSWVGSQFEVNVGIPKGFQGKLYAHFHDWNSVERRTRVSFEGEELGVLDSYDGPGVWLGFPVNSAQSEDGQLCLHVSTESGPNTMITELMVVPK